MPYLCSKGPCRCAAHQGHTYLLLQRGLRKTVRGKEPRVTAGGRMTLNKRYSSRALILFAAFLLLTCISPLPETPTRHTDAFKTLLSSLDGTIKLVIQKSRYTTL